MHDSDLITQWLHDRPTKTIESYRVDINQFMQFVGKPLSGVELEDIQQFSTHLQQRNLKESSRRRKLNTIKSLFSFAVRQRYLPSSPAAAIRLPKTRNNIALKVLRKEDTMKLINAAKRDRDRLFLLLMYATGARVSEVCGMKWVDFTYQASGKVQVTILGKGSKTRSVLIPDSVWTELQTLRGGEKLFAFTRHQAHRIIKQAAVNAGLSPDISCHFLRHSHAVDSLNAGAPLHVLRTTLGHATLQTTDTYLQSFPDESSSDFLGL